MNRRGTGQACQPCVPVCWSVFIASHDQSALRELGFGTGRSCENAVSKSLGLSSRACDFLKSSHFSFGCLFHMSRSNLKEQSAPREPAEAGTTSRPTGSTGLNRDRASLEHCSNTVIKYSLKEEDARENFVPRTAVSEVQSARRPESFWGTGQRALLDLSPRLPSFKVQRIWTGGQPA